MWLAFLPSQKISKSQQGYSCFSGERSTKLSKYIDITTQTLAQSHRVRHMELLFVFVGNHPAIYTMIADIDPYIALNSLQSEILTVRIY